MREELELPVRLSQIGFKGKWCGSPRRFRSVNACKCARNYEAVVSEAAVLDHPGTDALVFFAAKNAAPGEDADGQYEHKRHSCTTLPNDPPHGPSSGRECPILYQIFV